jgi:EAL domain-containing protein (putative c-di-GMP-specific phosphodiesterase class I)
MASTRANTSFNDWLVRKRQLPEDSLTDTLEGFLCAATGHGMLAVVSLENIGWIMRQYGLRAREKVTQEFDTRLRRLLRDGDGYFQICDDLICIVFLNLISSSHSLLAANRMQKLFDEPVVLSGAQVPFVVRAGMVNFPSCDSVRDADRLFRAADVARDAAAELNKHFEIVSIEDNPVVEGRDLTPEFQTAMEDGLVTLDYQPKYRLSDGVLVGAEALIRWRRESIVVPPNEFIPRLNAVQIWDMTKYCIRRAIREMQNFDQPIAIAVNIDPVALSHPEFLDFVRKECRLWSVSPEYLAIEVTESAAIDDYQQTNELLNALRSQGHQVAIDDFGTGQATLQHFKNLAADEIKVDRQFISNIVNSAEDRNIVESVIDMAHRSEKTVVAEGIEDGHTVGLLIDLGCDIGQGFYLGMPMSCDHFTQLIHGLQSLSIES